MKKTSKIMAIDTLDSYETLHIVCDYPLITDIKDNELSFKIGDTEISLLFSSEYAVNILKNALVTMSENIEANQKSNLEAVDIVAKNKKEKKETKNGKQ